MQPDTKKEVNRAMSQSKLRNKRNDQRHKVKKVQKDDSSEIVVGKPFNGC